MVEEYRESGADLAERLSQIYYGVLDFTLRLLYKKVTTYEFALHFRALSDFATLRLVDARTTLLESEKFKGTILNYAIYLCFCRRFIEADVELNKLDPNSNIQAKRWKARSMMGQGMLTNPELDFEFIKNHFLSLPTKFVMETSAAWADLGEVNFEKYRHFKTIPGAEEYFYSAVKHYIRAIKCLPELGDEMYTKLDPKNVKLILCTKLDHANALGRTLLQAKNGGSLGLQMYFRGMCQIVPVLFPYTSEIPTGSRIYALGCRSIGISYLKLSYEDEESAVEYKGKAEYWIKMAMAMQENIGLAFDLYETQAVFRCLNIVGSDVATVIIPPELYKKCEMLVELIDAQAQE